MFIYANPRIVLNGFETFVPFQTVESLLHQRLSEMTSNDNNAWSGFMPVSSTSESWTYDSEIFNREENFSDSNQYSAYFPDNYSIAQPSSTDVPIETSYISRDQGQRPSRMRNFSYQRGHQDETVNMAGLDDHSPMLGSDYSRWSILRGHGSFSEFSKGSIGAKQFEYQNSNESSSTKSGFSTATTQPTRHDTETFDVNSTAPRTKYNNYTPTDTSIDPKALLAYSTTSHNNTGRDNWWPDVLRKQQCVSGQRNKVLVSNDGLPRYPYQHAQQYGNPWNMESHSSVSQATAPHTVSPKELTMKAPSVSLSSAGSSQLGSMEYCSDSSSTASSFKDSTADLSEPEDLAVAEPPKPPTVRSSPQSNLERRPRQMLPSEPQISRRTVPESPEVRRCNNENRRKSSLKISLKSSAHESKGPANETLAAPVVSKKRGNTMQTKFESQKRAEPKKVKLLAPVESQSTASRNISTTEQAEHHRNARDDFLVKSKLAGMSYKEIRQEGNFKEAESTLRGRFRTLTKHKAARVRKPEWEEKDIKLLKKAVQKLRKGSKLNGRIPWKEVAEYIVNNGGSYHFGNATCRKRWDELQERPS